MINHCFLIIISSLIVLSKYLNYFKVIALNQKTHEYKVDKGEILAGCVQREIVKMEKNDRSHK